ncbi:MAG: hypothetical protein ACD_46C00559G0001 [uncultured bacterium]|nr:MAG: hypothetical protein ACD_46C00559G0001 [uncultured bacterium]
MHDITNIWIWAGFTVFLIAALGIDTFALKKHHRHAESIRSALFWTCVWIGSALLFNFLLWFYLYLTTDSATAYKKALDFFTGYLIEKSLSVDNLFAFYMVFEQFRIPVKYQQRIFSYGIWGAIMMRLIIILIGTWLISHFHWLLYVMGIFLLLTGIKMFFAQEHKKDLAETAVIRLTKRLFRLTHEIDDNRFFIRKSGLLYATPLFLALVFIEFSDLIFAMDSIPAIFAITRDPFIVWTSNIFAILGLRALYFVLARMINRFQLLKYGIALILIFIGIKMVIEPWIIISVSASLSVVVSIILVFVLISIRQSARLEKL